MNETNSPTDARALHLVWNGVEWVDDRCGCRYHPDDPNMTHGGAPHVHPCERHTKAVGMVEEASVPGGAVDDEPKWDACAEPHCPVMHSNPNYCDRHSDREKK